MTVQKLTYPSKENSVQEKINEIIDNLGGGYSAGTGIDISNNTISVDNTVAMKTDIPVPVTETTVSDWGFTKNTGTVTSVNNVSPVNGNVTLNIPDEQVEWATYGTTTFQQVCDWNTAGKVVFVKRTTNSNEVYIYRLVYVSAQSCTFNQVNGSAKAINYVSVSSSDYWSYNFYIVQKAIPSGTAGQVVTYTGVQGEVGSASLATVATSGSYDDLSNKPTIPTVNNATLTITQGGTSKGTFTANASSDVTIALDAGGGGASRNIGEIVASTIPLTDAGLHLLDGSLISGSGSYADFVTYIAGLVSDYPDLFTTEASWQSAVATYGVCGKFVYDSTNQTVRLPKYSNKFWSGGGTTSVFGDGKTLGFTNGTVNAGLVQSEYLSTRTNQYNTGVGTAISGSGISSGKSLGVVTSGESGLIADLSTITTALDGYWYIVIATSTKTQIEVDIDEIATDLNGKADTDLTNASGKSGLRRLVEVYNNGTSWYKVFQEYDKTTGNLIGNWCEQGGESPNKTYTTINLLKPFKDTNYYLNASTLTTSYTSNATGNAYARIISASQVGIAGYNDGNWTLPRWEAKGYIS